MPAFVDTTNYLLMPPCHADYAAAAAMMPPRRAICHFRSLLIFSLFHITYYCYAMLPMFFATATLYCHAVAIYAAAINDAAAVDFAFFFAAAAIFY